MNNKRYAVTDCSSLVLVSLVIMLIAGCNSQPRSADRVSEGIIEPADSTTVAVVGDQKITMADIRNRSGADLDRMRSQYLQIRSSIIDDAIADVVKEWLIEAESAKTGKTTDQLIADAGGDVAPTEDEIARWYYENRNRVGTRTLAEVRPQIEGYLRNQKRVKVAADLDAKLRRQHRVVVRFQPYRLQFSNEHSPTVGTDSAPITLVEFSDFQCPFCRRFAPTLKQIRDQYPDKVRIVYRQFPIPSLHPDALKAAEASLCANEQGKFWELHDAMFADQTSLSVPALKAKAPSLGISSRQFNECIDSGKFAATVRNDIAEGTRAGVAGTPAIFVNGIELKGGAVEFDVVRAAIEMELARRSTSN